jgi:hypothetical protein
MRLLRLIALLVWTAAVPEPGLAQSVAPAISGTDRTRLAEARRLIAAVGDSVWPGWSESPSAVLLVTAEREYLLWHPSPSGDFTRAGHDSLLASDVYTRPRQFPPTLLATFPAVGGVPTIVVGTAEQTGKRSTSWILAIAHEHFHQWQTSRPDYYARVAALDLAKGDSTGMWMLNHPFPYASPVVRKEFDALARDLRAALRDTIATNHQRHAMIIASARRRLGASLDEPDRRYLDFQLWQEGIARYTEYRVARLAATSYSPTEAFRALPDAEQFDSAAGRMLREITETERVSLDAQRVAFYPLGAALGLWLDRDDPAWRRRYIDRMVSIDSAVPPQR